MTKKTTKAPKIGSDEASFDLVEEGPVTEYLKSLAPTGKTTTESGLRTIAHLTTADSSWLDRKRDINKFPWHKLRVGHISRLPQQLSIEYKPNTIRRMLSALKQVVPFVRKQMPADEYIDVMEALKKAPKRLPNDDADPRGRALTDEEALRLIEAANRHPNKLKGARDAAIIAVMYGQVFVE